MRMRIGAMELIVIIVVAFALLKPDSLEDCAVSIGKAVKSFSKVRNEVDDEVIKPVMDAVAEAADEVKGGDV